MKDTHNYQSSDEPGPGGSTIHNYPKGRENATWKEKLIATLAHFFFFQLTFGLGVGIPILGILLLDYRLIVFTLLVMVLQSFAPKCEWIIRFANKYVKPMLHYNKYQKIYDEPIKD